MSTRSSGPSSIAVDAMGADLGPSEMVAGAALALSTLDNLDPIIMVGDEAQLVPLLAEAGLSDHPQISIRHASEVIEMDDKPLQALKRKRDSSMLRAIELVKSGEAKVVVSCGNTGSLMAGGTLRLRTLDGIERPALAMVVPKKADHFILVDAGANPAAKPEHLVHNAILGSHYANVSLGIGRPRVGLLSIGTEEGKGNELVTETHELLKKLGSLIDYRGPIEGFHVFDNAVDVVVADGFTGNVLLKASESLFKLLSGYLREELARNMIRKLGAFLSKGAFMTMKQQLSPDNYGGAPLLGLKGNILKGHGSSNRTSVMHAIRIAHEMIAADFNRHIITDIEVANDLIARPVA
jgi:glycerol-3-phosphate acyltransferase PlsX